MSHDYKIKRFVSQVDGDMKKLMREIQDERIRNGLDSNRTKISETRISKALANDPLVRGVVKKRLVKLPRKEDFI